MSKSLRGSWARFARIHQTLRVTPSMKAGMSDRVWTFQEIVGLLKFRQRMSQSLRERIEAVEIQFEVLRTEIMRFHEDTPPPRIAAALEILKVKIKGLGRNSPGT